MCYDKGRRCGPIGWSRSDLKNNTLYVHLHDRQSRVLRMRGRAEIDLHGINTPGCDDFENVAVFAKGTTRSKTSNLLNRIGHSTERGGNGQSQHPGKQYLSDDTIVCLACHGADAEERANRNMGG